MPVGLKDSSRESDSANAGLPHIAQLIDDGEITVGILYPVGCVAVATETQSNSTPGAHLH
jgi:hypothetical protein